MYVYEDYENAGIYTAALLDAYMDYKSIWKQVQTMNWEFENGTYDGVPHFKRACQRLEHFGGNTQMRHKLNVMRHELNVMPHELNVISGHTRHLPGVHF